MEIVRFWGIDFLLESGIFRQFWSFFDIFIKNLAILALKKWTNLDQKFDFAKLIRASKLSDKATKSQCLKLI